MKREREKEWLRREGRNPRNVFGPEAPVTTADERSDGLLELLSVTKVLKWVNTLGAGET